MAVYGVEGMDEALGDLCTASEAMVENDGKLVEMLRDYLSQSELE